MKLKIFLFTCLLGITCLVQAQPYTSLQNNPEDQTNNFLPFGARAIDYTGFPGYVDPIDYLGKTCFDVMGKVDFTSEYRFKTDSEGIYKRQYGFSIPLVGDIDGDGYPEVLSIGQYAAGNYLNGAYTFLDIFNGQTGERLARLRLDQQASGGETYYYANGFHQSPSNMAMVKLRKEDVGGTKDQVVIVMTLPQGSSNTTLAPNRNKVVCYNLDVSGSTYTIGSTPRWVSTADYNSDAPTKEWDKPIPQIVDIDGDGKPEVLVYNKLYDVHSGELLITFDKLGTTANVGSTAGGHAYDKYIGFSYIYDLDLDGKYDVVAGNKVYYNINLTNKTYQTVTLPVVSNGDGHTGVADINGDGIPDIVTVRRTTPNSYHSGKVNITVWDPGFLSLNGAGEVVKNTTLAAPKEIANQTIDWDTNATAQGSHSYVYIGDIDGREQEYGGKKYRLPEIAILSGNINFGTTPQHPNVLGQGIPTTKWSNEVGSLAGPQGVLAAFTFDPSETNVSRKLKLSFVLGHDDRSINTGFTMFDFDNDGMQEICYRDERTLRIIKAKTPFVTSTMTEVTNPDIILFSKVAMSFTGFEYPVIADVDNDASAEMLVLARPSGGTDDAAGFVFSVGNGSGDKFAPALSVWNQFMYDPFKINEDLTTPKGPAPNRLDKKYVMSKVIRNENMEISNIIEDYNPFNGTLAQMTKYQVSDVLWNGTTYESGFEPIIFLTHSYFVEPSLTSPAKNPKIVKEGGKIYIVAWVGNESEAQTDLSQNTPVAVYKNEISKTSIYKMTTLAQAGLNSAVKAGQEREIKIEVNDEFGYYILRLGDNSFNLTSPYAFKGAWSYGTNVLGVQDDENHIGTAARAYRDCNWGDQVLKVSKFMVSDDAYTLQSYRRINTPILDNDIMPDDFIGGFDGPSPRVIITQQPKSGIVIASGEINRPANTNTVQVEYQHTGSLDLVDGIDMFEYEVSYYDAATSTTKQVKAKAYFYILQDLNERNTACVGDNITLNLRTKPVGTTFKWYEADGLVELANNPQNGITISNITSTLKYMILPQIPSSNTTYGNINFPKGEFTIVVVPSTNADLKWTGVVNKIWNNPYNWTDLSGNAVNYSPVSCVNVTIPMITTNYPEMSVLGQSGKLTLMDRAMIGNVHKLTYESVSVEMTIKSTEQNRWLMLSAPLSSLYVGDYKVKDTGGNQVEKAAYISLYNTQNPDNEQAAENSTLSRPFGKIEHSLKLGTGFMLYIDELFAVNSSYRFPTTTNQYLYTPNNAVGAASRDYNSDQLTRTNSGRFIFEEANNYNATNGSFSITLNDDKYHLVVNPFPSYLNLNAFLNENTMLEPQYKVWTGKKDDTFVSLVSGNNKAPRWEISATATMESVNLTGTPAIYIAPYQAFFVKKKTTGAGSTVITFKPETMTITKAGDYTL